jgi:hypothetical protein
MELHDYTQTTSRIGNFARRLPRFFVWSEQPLFKQQVASEDNKYGAKPTQAGAPEQRFVVRGKASRKTDS